MNMQTISLIEFILVSTGSILIYVLIKTLFEKHNK